MPKSLIAAFPARIVRLEVGFHVPGTVFTGNADLLGSLRHLRGVAVMDGIVLKMEVRRVLNFDANISWWRLAKRQP